MKRSFFLMVVMLVLSFTFFFLVSADDNIPSIKSTKIKIDAKGEPQLIIKGSSFGNDPSAVQVMINENGTFAPIIKISPNKLKVALPTSQTCNGTIVVRVLVNRQPSNPAALDINFGSPRLTDIAPQHAESGTVIEVKGQNLSCQRENNLVTFNDLPATVLAVNGNSLSVRVPENITTGNAQVRVKVGNQISDAIDFTIDSIGNGNGGGNGSGSGNGNGNLQYVNPNGIPGSAGFGPLFVIKGGSVFDGGAESSLYDANFYGNHQTIINVPWQTVDGQQQVALLTLNCGHSNSLIGNNSGQFEKFIYMRVNFPLHPEKAYDPDNNPFFWGASGICTESFPHGELYFNSLTRSTGGVDLFSMAQIVPGEAKMRLTMKVVAPDLYNYELYGMNYAKAGAGIVSMPKVASIIIDLDKITTRIPVPQYNLGNVTFVDESGKYGLMKSSGVQFFSNVLNNTTQPQL